MSSETVPVEQIFLRPLGSPLTLGMSGLTVASLVDSGLDLHWIGSGQAHDVGYILLTLPFALQLIACVLSYLARDGAVGAAVGVLSLSWFALGLIQTNSPPGSRSGAAGLMLVAAGTVVILSALAVTTTKPLPALVLALAGVRFLLSSIYLLGAAPGWREASGVLGLVVVALAAYCVLAFELEGARHRPVLPTFRVDSGRSHAETETSSQIDDLAREPGVRPTT